ncbi:protein of unknown function [Paraburkholderia dioscoreae]|uniref:Uncharacterized protein n=1 Tax=Paraburkholderia dioscoreae TaxID=2604047 RepID=A0A5Q4ZFG1_9BURK|nr:protein of unknown function [Paraburkholderia dioscoreae]
MPTRSATCATSVEKAAAGDMSAETVPVRLSAFSEVRSCAEATSRMGGVEFIGSSRVSPKADGSEVNVRWRVAGAPRKLRYQSYNVSIFTTMPALGGKQCGHDRAIQFAS